MKNPSIYIAGKVWHAPEFQAMRPKFNIISRWIDLDNESDLVLNRKNELWQMCLEDSTKADMMVVWCGDFEEEQRGVLVEMGHAIAAGKPVFIFNTCKTFEPNGISDCAFTHHPLVYWFKAPTGRISLKDSLGLARYAYKGWAVKEREVV